MFQFTHPVWGATCLVSCYLLCSARFNSRTPCGVRLVSMICPSRYIVFQFTHPVWGATPRVSALEQVIDVSIHAPRVGCDKAIGDISMGDAQFQFTHPVWGATQQSTHRDSSVGFNSRTPCGVRQNIDLITMGVCCFNSRTPCGVRLIGTCLETLVRSFNSRTPCGVRLSDLNVMVARGTFQFTHPVWGATRSRSPGREFYCCFNSRTPCGVRLGGSRAGIGEPQFQFTHPVWGATPQPRLFTNCWISFNSRTPCGVRPEMQTQSSEKIAVSIHAPRVGCDFVWRGL